MITIAAHWPLSALCQRSWWPNHPFLQIVQESSWLGGILPSINLLHNLASARFFQAPGSAEPLFLAEALCNGVTAIIFPRMATEKSEGTARPAQARIEWNSSVQQELGKGTLPPSPEEEEGKRTALDRAGSSSISSYLDCMRGAQHARCPLSGGARPPQTLSKTRAAPPAQRAVPGPERGRSRPRQG